MKLLEINKQKSPINVGKFYFHSNCIPKNFQLEKKFVNRIVEINLLKKDKIEINRKIEGGFSLFYYSDKEKFILSSDIPSISISIPLNENKEVIPELLTQGYIFPPATLYKNVYRLPLLNKIVLDLSKSVVQVHIKKKFLIPTKKGEDPNFLYFLRKNIQLSSKRNVTLLFSGGLDSSIISKLLKKDRYRSYSTGFEFTKKDCIERDYAFSAAKRLGIDTNYTSFDLKELLISLPEAIDCIGEPINHIQTLLLYNLFKKKKKYMHKIVLNGQGADGIFGTSHQYEMLHNPKTSLIGRDIPKYPFLYEEYNTNPTKNNTKVMEQLNKLNSLDKDFILDLVGDVDITLHSWSTCASINNLSMEYPFFKEDYIKKISKIEWAERLKERKFYLKEIARAYGIDKNIINRKKASFGPISRGWGNFILILIQIYEPFFIKKELKKFIQKKENRYILWNILNYSIWKKIYIEGCSANSLKEEIYKILNNENKKHKKIS